MPVVFAAHGAPMLLDDAEWMEELGAWARALPRPKAVLAVSAHWIERAATVGATRTIPLVYDFYGFAPKYYRLEYPSPGAPVLAERVRGLLGDAAVEFATDPGRGLDHGVYVPLVAMYPRAEIPVLQLSLPALDPEALVRLGHALAPLRDEGVLLFTSGFVTHNMAYAFVRGVPDWAREFDAYVEDALVRRDLDALAGFARHAPSAAMALPTWEHFAPLLVAAGASSAADAISFPITGWWGGGAFTKRSVQFG